MIWDIADYVESYVYKEIAPYEFKEVLYDPITKEYKDINGRYEEDIISFPPYCLVKMSANRWAASDVHFLDGSIGRIGYSSNKYINALTNICHHYIGNVYAGRENIRELGNMEIRYNAVLYSGGNCISYNILIGHLVLYNPNIYPEGDRRQFENFIKEYYKIHRILGKGYFTEGIEDCRKTEVAAKLLDEHFFIKLKKPKHYLL